VLRAADHVGAGAPALRGACGQPAVDAEVRLVDADGADVPTGEAGEVAVRAPFAMAGYHAAPELNQAVALPGGFIRTRDVGRFDERGYLYLIDRTSDMIVTGGYNVYPREVEDAIAELPGVMLCAVVGRPDETWVEAVAAFVVRRPGAALTEDEVRDACRARLAGYKVPKLVRFIDQMPLSPVGKPLRRVLRDPLWGRG
jgi:fatty-acyl-CoA synthase